MTFGAGAATTFLFLGDLAALIASLWLTLFIRYAQVPTLTLLSDHALPFAFLFALWLLVFYMAGLYGKRVVLSNTVLFGSILRTQLANIILAALFFFFFADSIGIAPKTNLVLYLLVSLVLIMVWRLALFPRLSRPVSRERVALVGDGQEVEELMRESHNPRYRMDIVFSAAPREVSEATDTFRARLSEERVTALIIDADGEAMRPLLPKLYELAFVRPGYPVWDFHALYEEVFDRVPLSLLAYDWFIKNLSGTEDGFYRVAKRATDILGALIMGVVTLVLVPFIWGLMRLEGPGPLFIVQERIGRYGVPVRAYKFRSMRYSDEGAWKGEGENRVTKLGAFLRRTSIDEFPQCLNVVRGEFSLIGPRSDIRALGNRLGEAIPYYNLRYLVTPGITGWAQINQQYEPGNISPQSIEETKVRLAYDFYYIKNRSFALDVVIALKTVKRMLFRVSSW